MPGLISGFSVVYDCISQLFFVLMIAWLLRTFCGSFVEIFKLFFLVLFKMMLEF